MLIHTCMPWPAYYSKAHVAMAFRGTYNMAGFCLVQLAQLQ